MLQFLTALSAAIKHKKKYILKKECAPYVPQHWFSNLKKKNNSKKKKKRRGNSKEKERASNDLIATRMWIK